MCVTIPTPIPNLPRIKQVACGCTFSVCVDLEGFIWSFGYNNEGQLGTGNQNSYKAPQKILDIPPVQSVACGYYHTIIITNNSNLWSCGNNTFGQLCLGNSENQLTFQQTSFSNILKVSLGAYHSLFQNEKGQIYSCGSNGCGELGIGFNYGKKVDIPTIIPNLPPNIIQFFCAHKHSLFLDSDGNVFSVGNNSWGQLGIHVNDTNKDELIRIPNIPPIQIISCVSYSSYLVDKVGNLWVFGYNGAGLLLPNVQQSYRLPEETELRDITQLSYGCCGQHFLAKNSQNTIFVLGSNDYGQLGIVKKDSHPREMDSKYFSIWGDSYHFNKAKSARK